MRKVQLAPWQLSLIATVVIVAVNNPVLFRSLAAQSELASIGGVGFVVTVVLLMLFVLNTIILAFGFGRLQKGLIAILFVSSAALGFFSNKMGVVFDDTMFLNIAETARDNNLAEALELTSLPLFLHVLLLGVVPSLALLFVEVVPKRLFAEIGTRAVVWVFGLLLIVAVTLPNYKFVTYFGREHRDMRVMMTPVYPIHSLATILQGSLHRDAPFRVIDADAKQQKVATRRSIGIMVVGETARADHFSLDGYEKTTNPRLQAMDAILYARADSCGTSTLYSVPCMFSLRGREAYAPKYGTGESNVLDILTAAGVQTVWIDNNSSCKSVCDRIEQVDLRLNPDESSPLYSDMGYFDEVLLQSIDPYLGSDGPDLLIVLHTLGSHGPAYSRRYPPAFAVFSPQCSRVSPTDCSDAEVANAYDNTIVYTDYVLSQLINKLKEHADQFDAFLFYASDHGESPGEQGVYLHGLPYAIAPAAQTAVPFIVWLSPGFRERQRIEEDSAIRLARESLSHDNISHTLLGFFDVDASSYRPDLDMFRTTGTMMHADKLSKSLVLATGDD